MHRKAILRRIVAAGMLAIALAVPLRSLNTGAEGETSLTEMAKEVLALKGIDADKTSLDDLRFTESRIAETANLLEQYLEAKYPGVTFHPDNVILRSIDQAYDVFQLHVGTDGTEVRVEASETDDGVTFIDNYYGILKNDDYENWLGQRFGDFAPGMKVYSTIYCMLGERYNQAYPVDEAANDADFFAYTWFLLPPSGAPFDELADLFHSRIDSMGLSGEFMLYSMIDLLPEDMTKADAFVLIPSHSDSNPVYSNSARFIRRGSERRDER